MPSASLIKEFEQLVGKENVFSSEADRQSYAYDAAVLKPMIPSLVVRPTEVEQLGPGGETLLRGRHPHDRSRFGHEPYRRHHPGLVPTPSSF